MNESGADPLIRGALAGMAGTAMMTLMMKEVAPAMLPADMRPKEFPPKKVVEWAEQEAGRPHALQGTEVVVATMAAHFSYGTGSGAVYGLMRNALPKVPAPLAGMMFGVGLWAVGFEGWLPALGVQEATTEKAVKKWPAPIMAHLVYGTTTALAYEALDRVIH